MVLINLSRFKEFMNKIDNKNILIKKIKGKYHFFLDISSVPIEDIDLYINEIEQKMKFKKNINPNIMAIWNHNKL